MSKLRNALLPAIMVVAIVVAFGVLLFRTIWYGPDCKSPRQSISIVSIGGVVLLAGCEGAP